MESPFREPLINAYRRELKKRYQRENIERFPALANFSKDKTEPLAQFFLEYVYPPFSQRIQRDQALSALVGVLKSPSKLWPLRGMALRSIGRLAWDLGTAFKVAFRSIEVYLKSLDLEKLMLEEAQKLWVGPMEIVKNEKACIEKIMTRLAPPKVTRFQKDIFTLFRLLANSILLAKVIETMRTSQSIMGKNPHIYSEKEKAGLGYGLKMLEAGRRLFCKLDAKEVKLVLHAIRLVEEDWYKGCLKRNLE